MLILAGFVWFRDRGNTFAEAAAYGLMAPLMALSFFFQAAFLARSPDLAMVAETALVILAVAGIVRSHRAAGPRSGRTAVFFLRTPLAVPCPLGGGDPAGGAGLRGSSRRGVVAAALAGPGVREIRHVFRRRLLQPHIRPGPGQQPDAPPSLSPAPHGAGGGHLRVFGLAVHRLFHLRALQALRLAAHGGHRHPRGHEHAPAGVPRHDPGAGTRSGRGGGARSAGPVPRGGTAERPGSAGAGPGHSVRHIRRPVVPGVSGHSPRAVVHRAFPAPRRAHLVADDPPRPVVRPGRPGAVAGVFPGVAVCAQHGRRKALGGRPRHGFCSQRGRSSGVGGQSVSVLSGKRPPHPAGGPGV